MPTLETLLQFLAGLPRVRLGAFPTPLVPLARLGAELGIDLWMKRDDVSGLAIGGNKTRKLEFILADARARGSRTIVTVGPLTSNHTMMTAAAARRAGFDIHCVVAGTAPDRARDWSGNLLLLDYLGATLHFCPMDFTAPTAADARRVEALCAEVTAATDGYFVPAGGTMPQAEPGYMSAIAEIARQRAGRFDFDDVVLAFGTGSTTTGVLLGLALGGFTARVHPVAITNRASAEAFGQRPPRQLFDESVAHFGLDLAPDAISVHDIVYGCAEEGYGVPNAGSDAAIRRMASTEGYFLDTVYTAKAFAGLTTLVGDGRIPQGARVLFLHTGGLSMTPAAEKRFGYGTT
ncbi:MAG: pyridoxal-phosphate dependent enzyme [Vicinamibacterales bacterium]|nr:pyridoxal-phosphate dependent enzyme [Vicinamibacterales bacterium]